MPKRQRSSNSISPVVAKASAPPTSARVVASSTSTDWKQHPVVAAIVGGAATFGFCYKFALPVFQQKQFNDIASLTVKNGELNKKISEGEAQLVATKAQLDKARIELAKLETQDLFSKVDPFPAGWRDVRIGDSLAKIKKVYGRVDKSQPIAWSVNRESQPIFDYAGYYGAMPLGSTTLITSVIFVFDSDGAIESKHGLQALSKQQKHQVIEYQLSENFGKPKSVVDSIQRPELIWNAAGYNIELYDGNMTISLANGVK